MVTRRYKKMVSLRQQLDLSRKRSAFESHNQMIKLEGTDYDRFVVKKSHYLEAVRRKRSAQHEFLRHDGKQDLANAMES
jgi:hypothetical protein